MKTPGPLARLAASYIERGFSVLPIAHPDTRPGTKGKEPGYYSPTNGCYLRMTGWQRFCKAPASSRELECWIADDPEAGLGLACGFNDLIACDVDNVKAYGAVREVFGGIHPPTKIGRKGATAFFCSKGVLIESRKFLEKPFTDAEGKIHRPALVEILSLGNQTVIPDTIHPDTGKPYRWVHGSLVEVKHPRDLPLITQRHIDDLALALAPLMDAKRVVEPIATRSAAEVGDLDLKRYKGFALKVLDAEAATLAATSKPGRNQALFRASCLLGKYAVNGVIPSNMIVGAFKAACDSNGLIKENGLGDVTRTIRAGLDFSRNDALPILAERPHR